MFRYFLEYLGLILFGAWTLIILHLKKPFQVVHIHNMPDILILAGLIPKWMGSKLLLDIHDPMPELYASTHRLGQNRLILNILKLQEKFCCRLAHRVISVNDTMRENLEGKGIPPEKIFILHNFPDTKYLPIKNDITRWSPHKDAFILMYAGTITEHYRLDIAIEALAIVSKDLPFVKLKIIGDGNELNKVLKLATELGVDRNIEWLKPVAIDRLMDVMEGANVGISAHKVGIFGDLYFATKIIDYLIRGLPVVSSRTKTMVRYIPEDAIFYFEPENAKDMAKQIIKIWKSPDLVRKKMANAEKLLHRYTWQSEKHKLVNFYQELLK
jgi:glycosyltransferase involved in cell wall biosynthesis